MDKLTGVHETILDAFKKMVLPIMAFSSSKKQKIRLLGTSCLIQHRAINYILTAAHVFSPLPDKYIDEYYLSLLEGQFKLDVANFKTDSIIDIAVCPIMPYSDFDLTIGHYNYNVQPLIVPPLPDMEILQECYLLFGFPGSNSRYGYSAIEYELWARPLSFYTLNVTKQNVYKRYGLEPDDHIIVKYSKDDVKNADQEKARLPDPYGASGGMLLKSITRSDGLEILFYEGILTRWVGKQYVVALKKEKIAEFIDANFPS